MKPTLRSLPQKNTELKRGKGSQGVQNVAVEGESTPLEDIESGKKSKHYGYLKMKVLGGHDSKSVDEMVKENIKEPLGSVIGSVISSLSRLRNKHNYVFRNP